MLRTYSSSPLATVKRLQRRIIADNNIVNSIRRRRQFHPFRFPLLLTARNPPPPHALDGEFIGEFVTSISIYALTYRFSRIYSTSKRFVFSFLFSLLFFRHQHTRTREPRNALSQLPHYYGVRENYY